MRKVTLDLTIRVTVLADDDLSLGEFFGQTDMSFVCQDDKIAHKLDQIDAEITEIKTIDSR